MYNNHFSGRSSSVVLKFTACNDTFTWFSPNLMKFNGNIIHIFALRCIKVL